MPSSGTKHKALLFGGIGLLLAAIGVIASLILMNRPQDTRQKAATETGTAQVKITPATATIQPSQSTTSTVSFTTNGRVIQAIAVELNYAFSGSEPPMIASDIVIDPTIVVSGVECAVKTISDSVSPVKIEVGCNIANGFSTETFRDLFTFKLTAGPDGSDNPIPITFNTANTIIADSGEDIAAIPTGNLTVTLPAPAADTQKQMDVTYSADCNTSKLDVTATLTDGDDEPIVGNNVRFSFNNQNLEKVTDADGEAFVEFTFTDAGTYLLKINAEGFAEKQQNIQIAACPTSTPTPTPTQTVSCNGNCTTNSDCISSLYCYSGRCRSASCQSDTTCQCQTTNVASTSSTTQLPTTGSFDRTIVLLLIGGLLTLGGFQVLVGRSSHTKTEWTEGDSNP